MRIPRIWADADGGSHFEDAEEPASLWEYVPGIPSERTQRHPARDVHVSIPAVGAVIPWHPAPHRHLCVTVSGEVEIRVSDGESRRFRAGEMYLGEDLTGQGHEAVSIGEEPWVHVVVTLED